jgi:hypothetical protein
MPLEISPTATPQERQAKISELSKLLTTLRDVAKGKPLVDWDAVVAAAVQDPVEGAKSIAQSLQRFPSQLPAHLSAVAQRINAPERLAVVALLDEPFRSKVRDEVLQGVLKSLTSVTINTENFMSKRHASTPPPPPISTVDSDSSSGDQSQQQQDADDAEGFVPLATRMMVEMIRLDLVLIKGVATTLDTLLRDRNARQAAVAVIGLLAERYAQTQCNAIRSHHPAPAAAHGKGKQQPQQQSTTSSNSTNDDGILPMLNHVRSALQSAAADAAANSCGELDYDLNAIYRYMDWGHAPAPSSTTSSASASPKDAYHSQHQTLVRVPKPLTTPHEAITSMAYFACRDQLVTGGAERTISVWGSQVSGEVPSASFQLPAHTTPVSMDASIRGSLLAVGCVTSSKGGVPSSCVQAYLCSDSGAWTVGDVIKRPDRTVLTNVKCLAVKGSVVCTTETLLAADQPQHQVALFNAAGHETRVFARAHADCITALGVSADSDHLIITGSRDATVRLWDVRSPVTGSTNGAGSSPTSSTGHVVLNGHFDTITSIAPVRDVIVTTSLDGTMRVWDVRRTKTELCSKKFSSGVLKAVCTANLSAVVSTLRGLFLVSLLPTIEVDDVLPNVVCTDLRANFDGTVVFGASKDFISSFAIHGGSLKQTNLV